MFQPQLLGLTFDITLICLRLKKANITRLKGNLNCHCILHNSNIHSIETVTNDTTCHNLIKNVPCITKPRPDQETKHSIVHYIQTIGSTVTAKTWCFAPDHIHTAKAEFQNMNDLGHMQ